MDNQEQTKQDIISSYIAYMKEAGVHNLGVRDDMAIEQSIRLTELAISINVGVLGAIGIVAIIEAKMLFISSLLILIATILIVLGILDAFRLRSKIIEINRKVSDERGEFADLHIRKILSQSETILKDEVSMPDFIKAMDVLKEEEQNKFAEINVKLRDEEKPTFSILRRVRRTTTSILILIALFVCIEIIAKQDFISNCRSLFEILIRI